MTNRWIIYESYRAPICSVCGERENNFVGNGDAYGCSNYCPTCGAKMDGDVDIEPLECIGDCDTCVYKNSDDRDICQKCYETVWDAEHKHLLRRIYHGYTQDVDYVNELTLYKTRFEELMARKERKNG